MLIEDYVSFETAKLLKEKGFDEECSCFYNNIDYGTPGLEVDGQLYYKNSALDNEEYAAPTLQMAMKWLRDGHNIFINISFRFSYNADNDINFSYYAEKYGNYYGYGDGEFISYEEACEAAIKYCLENLI